MLMSAAIKGRTMKAALCCTRESDSYSSDIQGSQIGGALSELEDKGGECGDVWKV